MNILRGINTSKEETIRQQKEYQEKYGMYIVDKKTGKRKPFVELEY